MTSEVCPHPVDLSSKSLFWGTYATKKACPEAPKLLVVKDHWTARERLTETSFQDIVSAEIFPMLNEAGLENAFIIYTALVCDQPYGGDFRRFLYSTKEAREVGRLAYRDLYVRPELVAHRERLLRLTRYFEPDCIVILGNYALWALTDKVAIIKSEGGYRVAKGLAKWRGSALRTVTGHHAVCTYGPAHVQKDWAARYIAVHDLRARTTPPTRPTTHSFMIRPSHPRVVATLHKLIQSPEPLLAVDLETRGPFIACAGLAWSPTEALCIPFLTKTSESYWTVPEELEIRDLLKQLLTSKEIIGQNFLYDTQFIQHEWWFTPNCVYDTMLMQHLCFPGLPKGLDFLASLYCEHYVYGKDEGKLWEEGMPEEQLWRYNCMDACATYEVQGALNKLINKEGLQDQWAERMHEFYLSLSMMNRGVRVNTKLRNSMYEELEAARSDREELLASIIPMEEGRTPWWRSPAQLADLFYERLGIRPVLNKKTGRPTTDNEALETIAEREPLVRPIVELIQDLRSIGVFYSNFITALLDPDGRIRCSYNPSGTETFRWNSAKNAFGRGTNLQNVPKGSED